MKKNCFLSIHHPSFMVSLPPIQHMSSSGPTIILSGWRCACLQLKTAMNEWMNEWMINSLTNRSTKHSLAMALLSKAFFQVLLQEAQYIVLRAQVPMLFAGSLGDPSNFQAWTESRPFESKFASNCFIDWIKTLGCEFFKVEEICQ